MAGGRFWSDGELKYSDDCGKSVPPFPTTPSASLDDLPVSKRLVAGLDQGAQRHVVADHFPAERRAGLVGDHARPGVIGPCFEKQCVNAFQVHDVAGFEVARIAQLDAE